MFKSGTLFLIVVFCKIIYSAYSPNLEPNSDIELLINRLSSRYNVNVPANYYSQPFDYETINSFLSDTVSLDTLNFSKTERFLIDKAIRSINPQAGRLKWSSEEHDIHLKLHLKLLGDVRVGVSDSSSFGMRGIISPSFSGNIKALSFYSGIDVWTEYRSDTLFPQSSYQPYDGVPYNLFGRNTEGSKWRSSDLPRGGISYNAGRLVLETAIDYLKIGPAVYYPVTLSGRAPPVTYGRLNLDLGLINYSHVAGLLKEHKDYSKYLYVHRLTVLLPKYHLNIGFNEVIVTGSSFGESLGDTNLVNRNSQTRGWEWVYFIPFVPFKFAEHYIGDRDNVAMSFDIDLRWPENFRWYLEFFLDDMLSPLELFSNDWGNKWATTIGGEYYNTLLNHDFSINMEYSHVEPWVYTHFYGGSHRYTHFDQSLGSPLGPNSQSFVFSIQTQINRYHKVGLGITSLAKNSAARGGDITDIFQEEDDSDSTKYFDSLTKQFLGDGTIWHFRPGISYQFNQFGLFRLNARYEIELLEEHGRSIISLQGGFCY
jgi:hypothetical protein